ncbi:MAG: methyltransferase [Acidobacteriota bacterium]
MPTIPEIEALARGFMASRIVLTAVELDLFGVLGDVRMNARALGNALKADARGMERLADALVSLGILLKDGGEYRNTPESLEYLSSRSAQYRGGALRHMANLWKSWDRLTEVVRGGRAQEASWSDAEQRAFIQAMEHGSKGIAEKLAATLDLSRARRVLDLGGGPGTFSIAMARRQPGLTAVVLDLPHALDVARVAVDEAGLSERVTLKEGDFFEDDLGSGYDLVLVSSIIHSFDEVENLRLLARARDAIEPGGQLAIRDFLIDPTHTRPPHAAIFAVNMLVNTRAGRTYSFPEVSDWLHQLGLVDIQLKNLDERSQLIAATKPRQQSREWALRTERAEGGPSLL